MKQSLVRLAIELRPALPRPLALSALCLVACGGYPLAQGTQPAPLTISHPLEIRRHTGASLSPSQADTIVADTTASLAQCNSSAFRRGDVATYSSVSGVINSEADFVAQFSASLLGSATNGVDGDPAPLGTPRRVAVVNAINWCGGFGSSIIGCAFTPGTLIAVVRTQREGVLWAHEFGHSKGLPHIQNTTRVMNPILCASCTSFTNAECASIRALGFLPITDTSTPTVRKNLPVEEFVRQSFPHGVPYAEARKYGAADAGRLIGMIGKSTETSHWTNIITTLGIIADPRAFPALSGFILDGASGAVALDHYRAKSAAIISMGYIVFGTGDARALQFLQDFTVPSSWNSVSWFAPYQNNDVGARNKELSDNATIGLALSGSPVALQTLIDMSAKAAGASSALLIQEAVEANKVIQTNGLVEYELRKPRAQ